VFAEHRLGDVGTVGDGEHHLRRPAADGIILRAAIVSLVAIWLALVVPFAIVRRLAGLASSPVAGPPEIGLAITANPPFGRLKPADLIYLFGRTKFGFVLAP
jgi:hypothetical protein